MLSRAILWVVVGVVTTTSSAFGQFQAPVQITPDASGYESPELVLDFADNVQVIFLQGGDVLFANSAFNFANTNVTASVAIDDDGRISRGPVFSVDVVYTEEQPSGSGEIFVISNSGGPFNESLALTDDDLFDARPVVLRSSFQNRDVAWDRTPVAGPTEVLFSRDGVPGEVVALGSAPQLANPSGGDVFLGYSRDGELFGRRLVGGVWTSEEVIANLGGTSSDLSLNGDLGGVIHAVFLNGGTLYYTNDAGGSFGAPEIVETSPVVGSVRLDAREAGHVAVVYQRSGEVWLRERSGGSFGAAVSMAPAAGAATSPAVGIDSVGFVHVAFEDGGACYYTNNVPAPSANFVGTSTSGELPLTVSFTQLASGVVNEYLWDFGDGTTSSASNPAHTYTLPGAFTVSLTVNGPGGSDTEVKTNYVNTDLPPEYMRIPSILVFAGQPNVMHPVRATHLDPLQGFQVVLSYDEGFTPLQDVSLAGTVTNSVQPEFFLQELVEDGANSSLIVAVILDTLQPFDGRTIPPGSEQNLLTLVYDVPFSLSIGDTGWITLENGLGDPPINNIFAIEGGQSVLPYLVPGLVTIDPLPISLFLRADFNFDQILSLPDAILLLSFLFQQGVSPVCPDAADFDDDGLIGLADAISLLSFLFAGGGAPEYPYPGIGIDPTTDNLGPCAP